MVWLIGQVWVLCVIAFLAGSAVTWLMFVRPLRAAEPPVGHAEWAPLPVFKSREETPQEGRQAPAQPPSTMPPPPLQRREESRPAAPPVDPALAALDVTETGELPVVDRQGPAASANDALDRLGVGEATPPEIPAQAGPADVPPERKR
ncbi:hypothetical protein [Pseudonocardia sp. TRM90224]|uniref:hypothetical protein n=1 Tax=Pseudonocardia sp. TRM90224 TaxID=2812678 RepID=UPI001E2D6E19|nr:hypothetical protein [Pseudonocardia sp. TRM90224]